MHHLLNHEENGLIPFQQTYRFNMCSMRELIHGSTAFGGGILIAAVGLVLVPEGMQAFTLIPIILCFSAGSLFFFFVDRYMEKNGGTMAQLGMLSDFVPEAIAMGAVFSSNLTLGVLLAVIIAIQNLPESFNAFIDLITRYSTRKSLFILFLLSLSGLGSALAGYYFLADKPMAVGGLMLFSSGGIIYLIFQDIAPMSKLKKNWIPVLGASLGFLVGMIGVQVLAEGIRDEERSFSRLLGMS
jgi:ZIP family zinc transporter